MVTSSPVPGSSSFHDKQVGGMFVAASATKVVTSSPVARCHSTISYATCDDLTIFFKQIFLLFIYISLYKIISIMLPMHCLINSPSVWLDFLAIFNMLLTTSFYKLNNLLNN